MMRKYGLHFLLLIAILFTGIAAVRAQTTDPIERTWLNEEQTAKVQVYKGNDGKYYGKIIWLKIPTIDGKPKVDMHNPREARRNDPLIGLIILKGFKKEGAEGYGDGTVYDPKNGKTYSCKITRKNDKLEVRGYVGFSMLGRTTVWTKAD